MKTKNTNSTKPSHPVWAVGNNVFIRTVTHYLTGRVVSVDQSEVVLTDAAWIADTGRFHQAIQSGSWSEVEPYPDGQPVVVNRGAIVDATTIGNLPRTVK